jgi:hypothetical protein
MTEWFFLGATYSVSSYPAKIEKGKPKKQYISLSEKDKNDLERLLRQGY